MLASHVPTVLSKTKPEVPKDQTDEGRGEHHFFPGGVTELGCSRSVPQTMLLGLAAIRRGGLG